MSAMAGGRKSTSASPAEITAGAGWKGRTAVRAAAEAGLAFLAERYEVAWTPRIFERAGFFAGDDAARRRELNRTSGKQIGFTHSKSERSARFFYILDDDPGATDGGRLHWVSASELRFTVTPGLSLFPGLYDVRVDNANGAVATVAGVLVGQDVGSRQMAGLDILRTFYNSGRWVATSGNPKALDQQMYVAAHAHLGRAGVAIRAGGLRGTSAQAAVRIANKRILDVGAVDRCMRMPTAVRSAESAGCIYVRRRQHVVNAALVER